MVAQAFPISSPSFAGLQIPISFPHLWGRKAVLVQLIRCNVEWGLFTAPDAVLCGLTHRAPHQPRPVASLRPVKGCSSILSLPHQGKCPHASLLLQNASSLGLHTM